MVYAGPALFSSDPPHIFYGGHGRPSYVVS